jgi:hypothetical protein
MSKNTRDRDPRGRPGGQIFNFAFFLLAWLTLLFPFLPSTLNSPALSTITAREFRTRPATCQIRPSTN